MKTNQSRYRLNRYANHYEAKIEIMKTQSAVLADFFKCFMLSL